MLYVIETTCGLSWAVAKRADMPHATARIRRGMEGREADLERAARVLVERYEGHRVIGSATRTGGLYFIVDTEPDVKAAKLAALYGGGR